LVNDQRSERDENNRCNHRRIKVRNPMPPTVTARRFPPPWSVEEQPAPFVEPQKATTPL